MVTGFESDYEVANTKAGEFKRIAIPLVRRIYPSLIADKLVSVQPLNVVNVPPVFLPPAKYRSIDDDWSGT